MYRLLNFGLQAIAIALLIAILRRQRHLERKEDTIVSQEDTLIAGVRSLGEAVASEEAHIDTLIAALKEPHDSPLVGEAIAELEAIKARVSSFHKDDNPPPADPPPTDPDSSPS